MYVNGIEIRINRKSIKNLHLYVKPPDGHVEISAPNDIGEQALEIFIRTRLAWIRRQREKFEQQPRQTERQYISGETLYLWGQKYYLALEHGVHGNSISLNGNRAILTVRKESSAEQRGRFVNEWYRNILKAEIEKLLPDLEETCNIHCNGWQVKYMTTRWGTCNTRTGKIWLNLQLAKKPQECLKYIILHELLHLVERAHSKKFIELMTQYMPFWQEARDILNDQILDYMKPV